MVSVFPKFSGLALSDKAAIEAFAARYPPYSDYTFTSLWSWDTAGQVRIAELNGNLVVRFTDYVTGEPFYSFLGASRTTETIRTLLDFIECEGLTPELKLVPEHSLDGGVEDEVLVSEDRDNFDYVLSLASLEQYSGTLFRSKRNYVHRFKRSYASHTVSLDLQDSGIQRTLVEIFASWAAYKGLVSADVERERTALMRLFHATSCITYDAVGAVVNGDLAGFAINEVVGRGYAIQHFEKADMAAYVGICPYIMRESACGLRLRGCDLLNYEQDLGIAGLRESKRSYRPKLYLKKYVVCKYQT